MKIPSGHPLEGVALKLNRANYHLLELDQAINDFLEREPYSISYDRKSNGSRHIYRVHVHEEPPLAFGVIIGDCLQNMRSALDQLVWQLALRAGKRQTPSRQTAFPMCKAREEFRSKAAAGRVADLSADDRAKIERMQPYYVREPKQHWLWHLNELARVDRHRILHPVGGVQDTIDIATGYGDVKDFDFENFEVIPIAQFTINMSVTHAPFTDGAQVAKFGLSTVEPHIDMSRVVMKCEFAYKMSFAQDVGIAPAWGVVDVLGNIHHHINSEVLPPFANS